jgi:hypothetical protein
MKKPTRIRLSKPEGSISARVVRIGSGNARLERKKWIGLKVLNGGLADTRLDQAA